MDINLGVQFDNSVGLEFVQGEDRSILITLYDVCTLTPVDLTSATVGLNLPLQGGGSIKRTTGPVSIPTSDVTVPSPSGIGFVALTDHGFVTGDPVQVAAVGAGVLPTPLVTAIAYTIQTIDVNSFYFVDAGGNVINLTDQGSGSFDVNNTTDLVINGGTAILGKVTFNLRDLVSEAANALLAQTFQVSYTVGGRIRIAVIQNLLDVLFQPVP